MCGIAGIVSLSDSPLTPHHEAAVQRMLASMVHRGPDDEGVYLSPDRRVLLGHRRLSIIHPGSEAHQPMTGATGSVLCFNGEIYNYRELAQHNGISNSQSDTAVLLTLLEQQGESALQQLHGFFTFAMYDLRSNNVWIARDFIGKKPVYYAESNGVFLFASEIRALVSSGLVELNISRKACAQYLAYYSVRHPHTMFDGVYALEPGSVLEIKNRAVSTRRWYSLPAFSPIVITPTEAVRETRRLFEAAVRYRLVSDVPVGAFLSAGIDSNAIVAMMSQLTSEPVRTFTVGFDSATTEDESGLASQAAHSYGAKHHTIRIADGEIHKMLPQFFWHMDSPTGDALNSFIVSRATHSADPSIKVVLSGVGGDESFIGYRKYRWLAQRRRQLSLLWRLPETTRRRIGDMLRAGHSRLRTALRTAIAPEDIRLLFTSAELHALTGEDSMDLHIHTSDDTIERILRSDIEYHLPDMLLRDLDVTTMSQSLEGRAPLLDKDLLEFAWQLPIELRSYGGSKQLFVDAVADLLPAPIRMKKKSGFELPMQTWLRSGVLRPLLTELASGELAVIRDGLLEARAVARVYAQFLEGRAHYLKPWSIIALEYWYRSFVNDHTYEDWCSGAWATL